MVTVNTARIKKTLKAIECINRDAIYLRMPGNMIEMRIGGEQTTARVFEHEQLHEGGEDTWSAVVETRALLGLIKTATAETISIQNGENVITVDGIPTPKIDGKKPICSVEEDTIGIDFEGKYLADIFKRCKKFVTKPKQVYSTNGILLGDDLAVSTDCRRIAIVGDGCPEPAETGIVQVQTLKVAQELLKDGGTINIGEKYIVFKGGDGTVVSGRKIGGNFPRWKNIADDFAQARRIDVDLIGLRSAVEKAIVITKGEVAPKMELLLGEGLKTSAAGYEIQTVDYEGDVSVCEQEFTLNPVYLMDALKIIGKKDKKIAFEYRGVEESVRIDGWYILSPYVET